MKFFVLRPRLDAAAVSKTRTIRSKRFSRHSESYAKSPDPSARKKARKPSSTKDTKEPLVV